MKISSSCMGKNRKPIPIGYKIGKLVVIEESKKIGRWYFSKCKCECGTVKDIYENRLRTKTIHSCGCSKYDGLLKNSNRLPMGHACRNALYNNYINRAKINNIPFELSLSDFHSITSDHCHYCGIEPQQKIYIKTANGEYIYNGIDRKNNDKGYTLDNSVACCWTCNDMKKAMSYERFHQQIKKIYLKVVSRKV